MSRDFGGDAIEGVEKEMGVELEADELEFHFLNLRFGLQFFDFLVLQQEFGFEPEVGERPGQIDKPHQDGKKDPSLPKGNGLAKAMGGPSQIESGDDALQDRGVEGGGEAGENEGLSNKVGPANLKEVQVAIHPAEDARKEKPEKFRRQGNLEGSGKVLLHDGADEKSDEAECYPKDQIDPPEAGRVKKIPT